MLKSTLFEVWVKNFIKSVPFVRSWRGRETSPTGYGKMPLGKSQVA